MTKYEDAVEYVEEPVQATEYVEAPEYVEVPQEVVPGAYEGDAPVRPRESLAEVAAEGPLDWPDDGSRAKHQRYIDREIDEDRDYFAEAVALEHTDGP